MYVIVKNGLGQVAQWIELLTTDQKVGGSNPSLLTKYFNGVSGLVLKPHYFFCHPIAAAQQCGYCEFLEFT